MKQTYKISVIVPCYNQAQYLPETLQSILDQTYSYWECIIVNDGSPDNTEEIAKKYCEKDPRFKYLYKENGGLSSARNAGIRIAQGEYIQFLDSDDIIHPQKFELQLLNAAPGVGFLITSFYLFIENITDAFPDEWNKFQINNLSENILFDWDNDFVIPIHTALVHRDYFFKHNILFRENIKAKEDWIFWVECTQINDSYVHEKKVLAYYRRHEHNMSENLELMFEYTKEALFLIYSLLSDNQLKEKFVEKQIKTFIAKLTNKYIQSEKQFWIQRRGKRKYRKFFNILWIVCACLLIVLSYFIYLNMV